MAGRLARGSEPRLQLIADPLRAQQAAGDVVAHVGDDRGARRRRQQRVERGDAVRLGGRHGEPLRDVVEGAPADPADARRRGLERREQQVAAGPGLVAAPGDLAVGRDVAVAAVPAGSRPPDLGIERGIDRLALLRGGRGPDDVEVHRPECTRTRRARTRRVAEGEIRLAGDGGHAVRIESDEVGRGSAHPSAATRPRRFTPGALRPMPRNRIRIVIIAAAVAVVLANVLVRTPATPVAGGPSSDAAIDAWFDAERRDAGIPGAAVVVVRDGVVHAAGFGTADATRPPGRRQHAVPARIGVQGHHRPRRRPARGARPRRPRRARPPLPARVLRRGPSVRLDDHRPPAARPDERDPHGGRDRAARGARLVARRARPGARRRRARVGAGRRVPLLERQLRGARSPRGGRLGRVVRGVPPGARLRAAGHGPCDAPTRRRRARTASATPTACGSASPTPTSPSTARTSPRPASSARARTISVGISRPSWIPAGQAGGRVASAATVGALFSGSAATGVGDERYGLGWADTSYRGERMVAHAGSTTDMASFVALLPDRHTAVAVLFDAQSPLYELLHKPDQIGLGVLAMAMGQAPDGTLEGFYPIVDVALLVIVGLMGWRVLVLVRAPRVVPGAGAAVQRSVVPAPADRRARPARLPRRRGADRHPGEHARVPRGRLAGAHPDGHRARAGGDRRAAGRRRRGQGLALAARGGGAWPRSRPWPLARLGAMGTVERGQAWRAGHPAAAEVGVAAGAGGLVLLVAVWQWGATPDALLRGITLGTWMGIVVWLVARRRRVAEERARERAAAERADLRLTLARELHDTVAGDVAAIGIQAAAARRVIDTQPAEAAAALERIEVASRAANADLRRMLGALRSDDATSLAAAPGLAALPRAGRGADARPGGGDRGDDRSGRGAGDRPGAGPRRVPDRRGGHPQRPAPRGTRADHRRGGDRRRRPARRRRQRARPRVGRRARLRPRARRHARAGRGLRRHRRGRADARRRLPRGGAAAGGRRRRRATGTVT